MPQLDMPAAFGAASGLPRGGRDGEGKIEGEGPEVRADEAVELLGRWERSGERMSSWCAPRGLNGYSLSAYRGRLATKLDRKSRGEVAFSEVAFAEVVVNEPVERLVPIGGRYRVELGEAVVAV